MHILGGLEVEGARTSSFLALRAGVCHLMHSSTLHHAPLPPPFPTTSLFLRVFLTGGESEVNVILPLARAGLGGRD